MLWVVTGLKQLCYLQLKDLINVYESEGVQEIKSIQIKKNVFEPYIIRYHPTRLLQHADELQCKKTKLNIRSCFDSLKFVILYVYRKHFKSELKRSFL